MSNLPETKVCSKCGLAKPPSEYHRSGPGQLMPYCKPCHRKKCAERYAALKAGTLGDPQGRRRRREEAEAGVRTCSRCGRTKPLGDYHTQRCGRHVAFCKDCQKEGMRRRYHAAASPEMAARREAACRKRELAAAGRKACSRCGLEKALADYYRKGPSRLFSWCKACHSERCLAHYRANLEEGRAKRRDLRRKVRAADPEADNEKARRWRAANPEKAREAARRQEALPERKAKRAAYREANAEKRRAYNVNYRKANAHQKRAECARRRARLKGAGGRFTPAEWEAVKAAQGHRCKHCGRPEPEIKLTVDHVVPLARGGPNVAGNIQGLCLSCNSRKKDRMPEA